MQNIHQLRRQSFCTNIQHSFFARIFSWCQKKIYLTEILRGAAALLAPAKTPIVVLSTFRITQFTGSSVISFDQCSIWIFDHLSHI